MITIPKTTKNRQIKNALVREVKAFFVCLFMTTNNREGKSYE